MGGPKRGSRKKKTLILGQKQLWISGCVAFVGVVVLAMIAILLVSWMFGRA